jgi:hypothetical protein
VRPRHHQDLKREYISEQAFYFLFVRLDFCKSVEDEAKVLVEQSRSRSASEGRSSAPFG